MTRRSKQFSHRRHVDMNFWKLWVPIIMRRSITRSGIYPLCRNNITPTIAAAVYVMW